jgi:hypothetical protein
MKILWLLALLEWSDVQACRKFFKVKFQDDNLFFGLMTEMQELKDPG